MVPLCFSAFRSKVSKFVWILTLDTFGSGRIKQIYNRCSEDSMTLLPIVFFVCVSDRWQKLNRSPEENRAQKIQTKHRKMTRKPQSHVRILIYISNVGYYDKHRLVLWFWRPFWKSTVLSNTCFFWSLRSSEKCYQVLQKHKSKF